MNNSQDNLQLQNDKDIQKSQVTKHFSIHQKDRQNKSLAHLSQILANSHHPSKFPSVSSLNNFFDRTHLNSHHISIQQFKSPALKQIQQKPQTSDQIKRLNKTHIVISDFNRVSNSSSAHNSSAQINIAITENYKTVLNDFLRMSYCSEKFEKGLEGLQQAIKEALNVNEKLQSENRSLKKDLSRHTKMLEFLQISNKQKDQFFQQMVEQNINIKNELDELKLHKTQLQQIEMIKDLKSPIVIQSPQRKKLTYLNQNFSSASNQQSPKAIPVITKNENLMQLVKEKSQKWKQMKQVLEDHNIIQPVSQQNENGQNQQSNKKRTILINTQNIQSNSSTPVNQSPYNQQLQNSKFSKIFKNNRSSASQFSVDSTEKKNLRPLFIQHSTDHAQYASALDMEISKIQFLIILFKLNNSIIRLLFQINSLIFIHLQNLFHKTVLNFT